MVTTTDTGEPTGFGEADAAADTGDAAPADTPSLLRRAWDRSYYLVVRQALMTEHPAWERFFARRCPHLAGMIAYFGVLSIIPAAFLFISALALFGALESQGWIVAQVQDAIPGQGARTIVQTVDDMRENSGSLGVIGIVGLIWGTSNFLSCIESGLNIIYGVNNRHFIFQKMWVLFLMVAALVTMTAATLAFAVVRPMLERFDAVAQRTLDLPGFLDQDSIISNVVTVAVAFLFFLSCYRFLPNISTSTREVWRGAVLATAAFEASIRILPAYIGQDRGGVVISAFAGAFIVLVWFYLMALMLLIGGAYNWWWREKRRIAAASGELL